MSEKPRPNRPLHGEDIASYVAADWNSELRNILSDSGTLSKDDARDDQKVVEKFAGKRILDVGAGFESFASQLLALLKSRGTSAFIVNMGPVVLEKYYSGKESHELELTKAVISALKVTNMMGREGMHYGTSLPEDGTAQTLLQRNTVASLLQEAPFADHSFDIIISSMYYPQSLHAMERSQMISDDKKAEIPSISLQSLRELERLLAPGGVIHLGPYTNDKDSGAFMRVYQRYIAERPEDAGRLVIVKSRGALELRHAESAEKQSN